MSKKLEGSTYSLTVEGQCEKLYFEHLKNLINNCPTKRYHCVYKPEIRVKKSPFSHAKSFPSLGIPFFHIQDIEDHNDKFQREKFEDLLRDIKQAKRIVDYKLGYSNLTFDLWMCLHKKDMVVSRGHRKEYVIDINNAFNKHFEDIDDYKKEQEFKNILETITLDDVKAAIKRAKKIRYNNENGLSNIPNQRKVKHSNFEYFCENPDLNIHEIVEQMLKDCLGSELEDCNL